MRIVEAKDATTPKRPSKCCNAGVLVADRARLFGWLARKVVKNDNAKGEYYLTDIVALAAAEAGWWCTRRHRPGKRGHGLRHARQLAARPSGIFQERRRAKFLARASAMLAPDTVYFSYDTEIARRGGRSSSSWSSHPACRSRRAR